MTISDWPDEKEAEKADVSQILLPADMSFDEVPEETIFFKEIKPCGLLCTAIIPFLQSNGLDTGICVEVKTRAGIHSSDMKWRLFTRDKDLALQTAKAPIE